MTLESYQVYGPKYLNPPDHPAEQYQEFVCPYCNTTIVEDDGEMCTECQMEQAERWEDR